MRQTILIILGVLIFGMWGVVLYNFSHQEKIPTHDCTLTVRTKNGYTEKYLVKNVQGPCTIKRILGKERTRNEI